MMQNGVVKGCEGLRPTNLPRLTPAKFPLGAQLRARKRGAIRACPPLLTVPYNGCGSKSSSWGYAGFSLWLHLPRCYIYLSHIHTSPFGGFKRHFLVPVEVHTSLLVVLSVTFSRSLSALLPFLRGGFPYSRLHKKGYPYSNLPTGGLSFGPCLRVQVLFVDTPINSLEVMFVLDLIMHFCFTGCDI